MYYYKVMHLQQIYMHDYMAYRVNYNLTILNKYFPKE